MMDAIFKSCDIIEHVLNLRQSLNQTNITFLQVGANDGDYFDIAKYVISIDDTGIYLEPCVSSFNKLCKNRQKHRNKKFLNAALIPQTLAGSLNKLHYISDDEPNGGASLLSDHPNAHRVYYTETINTISVPQLLSQYSITHLDFFFCDTEGMDHLIVQELLQYIHPKVLLFESFHWLNNSKNIIQDQVNISIPSRDEIKKYLCQNNYLFVDFNECKFNPSENILAYQSNNP